MADLATNVQVSRALARREDDGSVSGIERMELWTVEDAARELHPEMSVTQVRALITLAGIEPVGKKPAGPYGGRRPNVYSGEDFRRAHAVIAALLIAA